MLINVSLSFRTKTRVLSLIKKGKILILSYLARKSKLHSKKKYYYLKTLIKGEKIIFLMLFLLLGECFGRGIYKLFSFFNHNEPFLFSRFSSLRFCLTIRIFVGFCFCQKENSLEKELLRICPYGGVSGDPLSRALEWIPVGILNLLWKGSLDILNVFLKDSWKNF